MATYTVYRSWEVIEACEINADSKEEALEIAEEEVVPVNWGHLDSEEGTTYTAELN